jgi:hypothetical protein
MEDFSFALNVFAKGLKNRHKNHYISKVIISGFLGLPHLRKCMYSVTICPGMSKNMS